MNRRQLKFTLLAGLVICLAGVGVYRKNSRSWQSANQSLGQKLLGDFQVNDVSEIGIKQSQAAVDLVIKDDVWTVRQRYNYPANFTEIRDFLRKAADLKVVQREQVGPDQLPRLELVDPTQKGGAGTLLTLKDKGGRVLKSVLLGKKYLKKSENASPYGGEDGWPAGRYVKVSGDSNDVAVISDPLTNIEPKPEQWLNKDFIKVEKLKSVSVLTPNATNQWKLARPTESAEMKLAEARPGENLDTAKASGASSVLSSPSFVDVVAPDAKPADTGLDTPTIATLETFDDFIYTIKIGRTNAADDSYVTVAVSANISKARVPEKDEKPADAAKLEKDFKEKIGRLEEKLKQEKTFERWTYLVSKWTVEPLLKSRSELMAEKKEEPKLSVPPAPDAKAKLPDAVPE